MLVNIIKLIKSFLFASVEHKYRKEFAEDINEVNLARGKITAIVFIVMEAVQFILWFNLNRGSLLNKPIIYYGAMYIILQAAMIVFLIVFFKLGADISKYDTAISLAGICFAGMFLLWCGGISLLDQLTSGQITVYTVAVIAIAVTPYYKPVNLLIVYLINHGIFIILLPYFQKSHEILQWNYINSTTFLLIAWVISCMRYKKQVDVFSIRKLLQQKNVQLQRVNNELEKANQKLERISLTDSLTSISNRMAFDKTIRTQWNSCKRYFIPMSLIMIDIDFFKAFNDNYGHQQGDQCLRKVAAALASCMRRSSDMVARYGGEEFAVIVTHMEQEKVLEYAEQLRKSVEQLSITHMYSSVAQCITISLGVHTEVPSEDSSVEKFIRTSDKALYEAKKSRNSTAVA